ncbi:hypothetical protein V7S43_002358 [Phytophthora oleae]|uniref:Uncharacterized protein n=1 Tax=Phytophthora oleae TaxID=2107226 RepID=A0ABD3G1U6_9STRA
MVRVASCRFLRLDCNEEDHPLFRREYARNNRERGVKLLRCFPHCCPKHVRRSYCGCSVHVLVTFSADVNAEPPSELLVCARFEPSRVVSLWPAGLADLARDLGATDVSDGSRREDKCRLDIGERVALPESLLTTASQTTGSGDAWVVAERETHTNHLELPKNVALYVLNKRLSPKWFYNYDSSVTRAQREMTHHLVAYVFQRLPAWMTVAQQQHNVVVVARHASPGFLLVSYRRSGAASNPGCLLPAFPVDRSADNNQDATPSEERSVSWIIQQQERQQHRLQLQLRQHYQDQQPQRILHHQLRTSSHVTDGNFMKRDPIQAAREIQPGNERNSPQICQRTSPENDTLWQFEADSRNPGFSEKAQHLLILWRFLQCVTPKDIALQRDTIDEFMRSHWLRAARALQEPSIGFNSTLEAAVSTFIRNIFTASVIGTHTRDQATIRECVHLLLRTMSSCTVQNILTDARQVASGANSGEQLREQFISLVENLYDALGDILGEVSTNPYTGPNLNGSDLSAMVDKVLSVVYGQVQFSGLRPEVSALLMNRHASSSRNALNGALQAFVTQVRQSQQQFSRGVDAGNTLGSLWARRWLLEPGSVRLTRADQHSNRFASDNVSLLSLTQFIREFGCVDLGFADGCMAVRSVIPFISGMRATSMELVLDGRLREFNALPSGISSKIATAGGWIVRDYVAVLADDTQPVIAHFFKFKEVEGAIQGASGEDGQVQVRRVSLSLTLEQQANYPDASTDSTDLFIVVHGTVCDSTYYSSRRNLSGLSLVDRGAIWERLEWISVLEVHAGYVAI